MTLVKGKRKKKKRKRNIQVNTGSPSGKDIPNAKPLN